MPRVAIKTFGCKVNLCDSRALAGRLEALGAAVVPGRDPDADAFVLNTCAVTDRAVRKCAQALRSILREKPGAAVAFYGCAATYGAGIPDLEGAAKFARGEEEALVAFLAEKLGLRGGGSGDTAKSQITNHKSQPNHNSPIATGKTPVESGTESDLRPSTFDFVPSAGDEAVSDPDLGRTRAFVKAGDGCDGACTYCVVPRLRGPCRSRAARDVCAEAAAFAAAGRREIVLTAIHLGAWGRDLAPPDSLAGLVRRVAGLPGVARVRLSSVEALEADDALLSLSDLPAFAPHFHLPLQSGDDGILRRMGRRYTAGEFLDRAARVREKFPAVGLTTDVIAGFPGETDEAFRNTLRVVREARFSRLHVFPFSPREGAPAASYPDRVPREVAKERVEALLALGSELAVAFRASRAGARDRVLAEREVPDRPGFVEGWDGVYQRVQCPGGPEDLGRLVPVRITGVVGDACVGERVLE